MATNESTMRRLGARLGAPDAQRSQIIELLELAASRPDAPDILAEAYRRRLNVAATLTLLRRPRLIAIDGGAS